MLAAADPRAIRALILVVFAISLGVAGPDARLRLTRAISPAFVPPAQSAPPVLQAWITPPFYTGQAPVFLKPDGTAITVPDGSRFQASLGGAAGSAGDVVLALGAQTLPFSALDSASSQIDALLSGTPALHVAIRRRGREVAGWDVTLVANEPPMLRFADRPGIVRGPQPQTRIAWEASHAYGVSTVTAEIRLRDRQMVPPLLLAMPLSGAVPGTAPKLFRGVRLQDLTAHPWAGLPVTIQLVGRDAPGQEGRSEIAELDLPQRRFANPVARALIELRRSLSRDPTARVPVIADLDRLAALPETWDSNTGGYLNLRGIRSLLRTSREASAIDEAQARMWSLALALEEGAAERAGRALEEARRELRDALDAEQRADRRDQTDLERKARDLQEALQKRLDTLAEQARRDPATDAYNPDAHPLDTRDMQALAQEMRDAAKSGDADKAREKLAELEKMMEALNAGRPEHGQQTERERQRAEKRQRGQQQMTAVQDIVKREGGVLDHAQSRAQSRLPGRAADQAQRADDQARQLALRRVIGELMQQYGDLTGDVPANLGEADLAMRDTAQALAESGDSQAAATAQRAIEALQKGAQQMRQQLARQFGQSGQGGDEDGEEGMEAQDGSGEGQGEDQGDGPGDGPGNRQPGSRTGNAPGQLPGRPGSNRQTGTRPSLHRDPLGRPSGNGTGGLDEAGDVQVPDQMEAARTRALQDELRRRGADRTRTQQELDYINRLLRQF
jgi:uncharacterized protein (TIGR02302 family)